MPPKKRASQPSGGDAPDPGAVIDVDMAAKALANVTRRPARRQREAEGDGGTAADLPHSAPAANIGADAQHLELTAASAASVEGYMRYLERHRNTLTLLQPREGGHGSRRVHSKVTSDLVTLSGAAVAAAGGATKMEEDVKPATTTMSAAVAASAVIDDDEDEWEAVVALSDNDGVDAADASVPAAKAEVKPEGLKSEAAMQKKEEPGIDPVAEAAQRRVQEQQERFDRRCRALKLRSVHFVLHLARGRALRKWAVNPTRWQHMVRRAPALAEGVAAAKARIAAERGTVATLESIGDIARHMDKLQAGWIAAGSIVGAAAGAQGPDSDRPVGVKEVLVALHEVFLLQLDPLPEKGETADAAVLTLPYPRKEDTPPPPFAMLKASAGPEDEVLRRTVEGRFIVNHPLWIVLAFVAIASAAGLHVRLITAFDPNGAGLDDATVVASDEEADDDVADDSTGAILGPRKKVASAKKVSTKSAAAQQASKKVKLTLDTWAEVWCPHRATFVSVNPCLPTATVSGDAGDVVHLAPRWDAPYALAFGGSYVVDVTPRYCAAWSHALQRRLDAAVAPGRRVTFTPIGGHGPIDKLREAAAATTPPPAVGGDTAAGTAATHQTAQQQQQQQQQKQTRQRGALTRRDFTPVPFFLSATFPKLPPGMRRTPANIVAIVNAAVADCRVPQQLRRCCFCAPAPSQLSVSDEIIQHCNGDVGGAPVFLMLLRERLQILLLQSAEPLPVTIQGVQKHPLFVLETQLGRFDAVYPRDATTIAGVLRGTPVYRKDRGAVWSLRSVEGWLRVGRILPADAVPYKLVAPSSTSQQGLGLGRPAGAPGEDGAGAAAGVLPKGTMRLYGYWQTQPFRPAPVNEDGTIPRVGGEGRTPTTGATTVSAAYALLDKRTPAVGLTHITLPSATLVARRMQLDFASALVGFERVPPPLSQRDGPAGRHQGQSSWKPLFDGVVVRDADSAALKAAIQEYANARQLREAAKRRQRAAMWWRLLITRRLAEARLHSDL